MNGIYLGSYKALHLDFDIVYQDINGLRDLDDCMLDIDLSIYNYIIATPPCNYWSRANYRRDISAYAINTKHLLPDILDKLIDLDKPFIVENVINRPLMKKYGLFDKNCYVYFYGRHTYFTNIPFNLSNIKFDIEKINNLSRSNRMGGKQVHFVIDYWLKLIHGELL